jgi:hypothetical protein
MTDTELLKKLYYDPKTGFVGSQALYKKAKEIDSNTKQKDVLAWLKTQVVGQIHKEQNRTTPFLPIFSTTPNSFQIDLAFLPKYKKINNNFEVILTCININTRVAYAYKAKDKKTPTIIGMLNEFYKDAKPKIITSDNGSEFISAQAQKWFEDHNIERHLAEPEDHHKMGMIERFNRTLKERLSKYFTSKDSPVWYTVLDDVIENYNTTYHRSIDTRPVDVTPKIERQLVAENKKITDAILGARTEVDLGTDVRIRVKKGKFDKGVSVFSDKVYTVDSITNLGSYRVRDNDGKLVRNKIKFEDIQIISTIEGEGKRDVVKKVEREAKVKRVLKEAGIADKNVVREKRKTRGFLPNRLR